MSDGSSRPDLCIPIVLVASGYVREVLRRVVTSRRYRHRLDFDLWLCSSFGNNGLQESGMTSIALHARVVIALSYSVIMVWNFRCAVRRAEARLEHRSCDTSSIALGSGCSQSSPWYFRDASTSKGSMADSCTCRHEPSRRNLHHRAPTSPRRGCLSRVTRRSTMLVRSQSQPS